MSATDYISVRDWRRRPPLRLRVTKKLDLHWCWIKCTRSRGWARSRSRLSPSGGASPAARREALKDWGRKGRW